MISGVYGVAGHQRPSPVYDLRSITSWRGQTGVKPLKKTCRLSAMTVTAAREIRPTSNCPGLRRRHKRPRRGEAGMKKSTAAWEVSACLGIDHRPGDIQGGPLPAPTA